MRRITSKWRNNVVVSREDNRTKLSLDIDLSQPGISIVEQVTIQRIQAMLQNEPLPIGEIHRQIVIAIATGLVDTMEHPSDPVWSGPRCMDRHKAYTKLSRALVRMDRYDRDPGRSLGELMDSFILEEKGRIS